MLLLLIYNKLESNKSIRKNIRFNIFIIFFGLYRLFNCAVNVFDISYILISKELAFNNFPEQMQVPHYKVSDGEVDVLNLFLSNIFYFIYHLIAKQLRPSFPQYCGVDILHLWSFLT